LEPDGALRDIYIFDTTLEDWQKVYTLASSFYASFQFSTAENEIAYPASIRPEHFKLESIFSFAAGPVPMSAWLFRPDRIELSFAPNDVPDERSFESLLAFIVELQRAIDKDVIVTIENLPEEPFLRIAGGEGVSYVGDA